MNKSDRTIIRNLAAEWIFNSNPATAGASAMTSCGERLLQEFGLTEDDIDQELMFRLWEEICRVNDVDPWGDEQDPGLDAFIDLWHLEGRKAIELRCFDAQGFFQELTL